MNRTKESMFTTLLEHGQSRNIPILSFVLEDRRRFKVECVGISSAEEYESTFSHGSIDYTVEFGHDLVEKYDLESDVGRLMMSQTGKDSYSDLEFLLAGARADQELVPVGVVSALEVLD